MRVELIQVQDVQIVSGGLASKAACSISVYIVPAFVDGSAIAYTLRAPSDDTQAKRPKRPEA